ncbi:exodeoxyribonuclease V subunit gamma [Thermodesulfobacteriota bacterium]
MPGIFLYSGNRLEVLADRFAEQLQNDPLPPLKKEIILVQSSGMARWLAMATATRLNIWANCECPFPNAFIRNIYRMIMPEISISSPFDRKLMTWHLMDILPELLDNPKFKKIRHYLESDDGLKLYQLADEIADLFDQYTLYRPDMILGWEANSFTVPTEYAWQPYLWTCLVKRLLADKDKFTAHRARLLKYFEEKIQAPELNTTGLPTRVNLFGVSSLPPYHLSVLASLAHHIDLHLFIMNPCMEFWFDIVADRDIVKISRQTSSTQEKLHLEQGNSLLSSMGHLGRDFLAMVQNLDCQEMELFQKPASKNLLSFIQQDILLLNGVDNNLHRISDKKMISDRDISVVFQSCHSSMREVEILHDQIMNILDRENAAESVEPVEPRDILVMAPDINEYAPLIRAIFGPERSPGIKMPHTISDQSIWNTSIYINSFFEILSLLKGRFSSMDILGLLKRKSVKNRFSIHDHDIPIIEKWIHDTRICWGVDSEHREKFNLPDYGENTWRAGLDRLLLGFATPGGNSRLFKEILPYDPIEGNVADLLGNFIDYIEVLFSFIEVIQQKHTPTEWFKILLHIKEKLLLADESTMEDENLLQHSLHGLKKIESRSSFKAKVPISVIQSYLSDTLDERYANMSGTAGFLSGGITFCSMLPMRAIPFKIICLLGMNEGKYPRSGRKRSFDLMALEPRRGDRSRRYDDRYLFLETILSARERLYISFKGQSLEDGSHTPPSVLVNELMDYIEQGYEIKNRDNEHVDIIRHLSTNHRLQPFHPDYFDSTDDSVKKLFSYSLENCAAAIALTSSSSSTPPAPISLPVPDESFKEIYINELNGFFSHPVRYFLTKRVGIAPLQESKNFNISEPFSIAGLDRYKLENDILKQLIAKQDPVELYRINKAEGILPHGKLGEVKFTQIVNSVRSFKKKIFPLLAHENPENLEIDLAVNGFNVSGQLKNITEKGLVLYRFATIKPQDMLRGWIHHLLLNKIKQDATSYPPQNTYLAGKDRIIQYNPVPEDNNYLEQLLDLYWQGLSEPLHFFPRTSYAFARHIDRGSSDLAAMQKAEIEWNGNSLYLPAEKNDPYNYLCFKGNDPAEALFMDQAKRIFLPIFEYQVSYTE